MAKKHLFEHLDSGVFCRLAPSPIHGVGVFAIKAIPAGTNPFPFIDLGYEKVTSEELVRRPEPVQKLIKDMCIYEEGVYYVPPDMNRLDIGTYLNHSATPNMVSDEEGEEFTAMRDIAEGEELTIDYRTYDDQPDPFK